MRGIKKETLIALISQCPSETISTNRFTYWVSTNGVEIEGYETYRPQENIKEEREEEL